MRKSLAALTAAVLLAGAPALADWHDWDADNDGAIDRREFDVALVREGLFERLDADGDRIVAPGEFRRGMAAVFGPDGDGGSGGGEHAAGLAREFVAAFGAGDADRGPATDAYFADTVPVLGQAEPGIATKSPFRKEKSEETGEIGYELFADGIFKAYGRQYRERAWAAEDGSIFDQGDWF